MNFLYLVYAFFGLGGLIVFCWGLKQRGLYNSIFNVSPTRIANILKPEEIPPYILNFYPICADKKHSVMFEYLPHNSNCFVNGCVDYDSSSLAFQNGKKKLIISGKTKAEFMKGLEETYKKMLETGVVFGCIGIGIYLFMQWVTA